MADLTETDLENMKNHKYKSTGYTSLDNKMYSFWNRCALLLPYSYSPNMVTVTGLFCQFLSIFLIMFYDMTFSETLPPYVYIFCAIMLFLAQTLDAIDGKHARNTNRTSSLGQLMDHGCDSMDNFLFCIVLAQAYSFGNTIHTLVLQVGIQIPFYTYTLEEHFTGVLRTQLHNVGVTEYQFLAMGLLILSSIMGNYLVSLSLFGIKIIYILLYITLIGSIVQSCYLIKINSNNILDLIKFRPLLTLLAFVYGELYTYKLHFYETKPLLIILLNGFYYSLFTCKLIINNMAKRNVTIVDIDIIVYLAGIISCVYIGSKIAEFFILVGITSWLGYRYYHEIIFTIFKLLDYLKISF